MFVSSDSDDDCYDKLPQKLQKLKSKHALNNPNRLKDLTDKSMVIDCDLGDSLITRQDSDVILVLDGNNDVGSTNIIPIEIDTQCDVQSTRSRRGKRKKSDIQLSSITPPKKGGKRGRGRGRGRGTQTSVASSPALRTRSRRGINAQSNSQPESVMVSRSSTSRGDRVHIPSRRRSPRVSEAITTYSIGNTDEYPDASDTQELFSNKSMKKTSASEVQEICPVVDLDESLDNEELSVKVYWQHSEVLKFNIRRLQKLKQIFDFFVGRESVRQDRLLFTYNHKRAIKIIHPDDTPDSINYNIAKFIEGGIVNKEFRLGSEGKLIDSPQKKGFILKFQCQNKKKPLEFSIDKSEKLQKAMVKCAESLEIPIAELLFEFDGETVQGNATPQDLDMDCGDCIDVKIISVNK